MPSATFHLPFQASVLVPSKRTLASEGALTGYEASAFDFAGLGAGGVVDGIFGTGDEGGVGIELFVGWFGEKGAGGKKGENYEFRFHKWIFIDC